MKILIVFVAATMFSGCARFGTKQTDYSFSDDGKPLRKITTKAHSYTLFESKSSLATWQANQTDKTQGAKVGGLTQEAGGTNTAATLSALAELLKTIKP